MEQYTLPIPTQSLFDDLTNELVLKRAFRDVKRNKGAAGIDGITIAAYEANLPEELAQLSKELLCWRYKPNPSGLMWGNGYIYHEEPCT